MNAQDIAAFDADAMAFARHNEEMAKTAHDAASAIDDKRDEINVRMSRMAEHMRKIGDEYLEVARLLRECHSDTRQSGSTVRENKEPATTSQFVLGEPQAQAGHVIMPVSEEAADEAARVTAEIDQQLEKVAA